jgi:hypothetical protein
VLLQKDPMSDWVVTLIVALSALLYVFARRARRRAGVQPVKVKLPLPWAALGFALIWLITAGNIFFFRLHGYPAGPYWLILIVVTVALVMTIRALMRRSSLAT